MARTTTRTQMIIGLMLESATSAIANIEEMDPSRVSFKDYYYSHNDPEFVKAQEIAIAEIERMIAKNQNRIIGSQSESIEEIDSPQEEE